MIDAHNALDVFLWLLLSIVPVLSIGLASLIIFGLLAIPAGIMESEGLFVIAALVAIVAGLVGTVIAFIHLPWWLGLFGYTDSHLILMSYIVFVSSAGGLSFASRSSD